MSPDTLPSSDLAQARDLLLEAAAILLLLAGATTSLLALRFHPARRALRTMARRRARLAWQRMDAVVVVAAALLLLAGNLMPAWRGELPAPPDPPSAGLLLVSVAMMPALALLLAAYRGVAARRAPADLFGIHRRDWRRHVLWGVFGGLAILLPSLLLSQLSGELLLRWNIPPALQDAMRWFRDPNTPLAVRLLVVFQGVLVAPILEEMLYRGILLSVVLRTSRPATAVLLVSVFFAALHLEAQVLLPLVFVGVSLAIGLLSTGSLATPIVMHMVFNAGNLLLVLAAG